MSGERAAQTEDKMENAILAAQVDPFLVTFEKRHATGALAGMVTTSKLAFATLREAKQYADCIAQLDYITVVSIA